MIAAGGGCPGWRPTRALAVSPHRGELLDALRWVAPFYPELSGMTIRVGILTRGRSLDGVTLPVGREPWIALRPHPRQPERVRFTAAHELTHLLQWPRGIVPQGERACDLHALARVGHCVAWPPRYLRVPPEARASWPRWQEVAHALAGEALRERARGLRMYLSWWEREFLRRMGSRCPRENAAPR